MTNRPEPDRQSVRFDEPREERRERLLAGYIDRLIAGEVVELEKIVEEEPDFGSEIVEQLRAFTGPVNAPPDHALGTLGDYTLRRQIGRGGMGVVYEAWENSMDRAVALKVLPGAVAADDKAYMRFMREARTAGKLSHANVVGVYGMGVKEHTPYYAMELVEGETLAQILSKVKEADPETDTPFGPKDQGDFFIRLARSFADVADGLQHAHSKGVVHRDIKPSNLILDGEGKLRILDFGLARLDGQESLTLSGDLTGTVLYMSPEQAMVKRIPLDHRTDVYSLGATMYEAICGRPPFRGKDHADTLSQIIERDPVGPRNVSPRVPKNLETVVLKCLRKESGQRYGTAEALGQDLRRFVRGDPIEAQPESPWTRMGRLARRGRRRYALGLSLLSILALSVMLFLSLRREEVRQKHASYAELLRQGIVGAELGIASYPSEPLAGEVLADGLVYAGDLQDWDRGLREQILDEAAATLKLAVAALPERPEAYVHLARVLHARGRHEAAEGALRAALLAQPSFPPALAALEHYEPEALRPSYANDRFAELWSQGRSAARDRDWTRVVEVQTQLLEAGAEGSEPWTGFLLETRLRRARVELFTKEYDRAIRDLAVIQATDVRGLGPGLLLATAYYQSERRTSARWVLTEILDSTPLPAHQVVRVASVCNHFGDFDFQNAAIERINDPALREAQLGLFATGTERERRLLRALEMGSKEPKVFVALAYGHVYTARQAQAREYCDEGLRLHPTSAELLAASAMVAFQSSRVEEAFERLGEALHVDPAAATVHNTLGWCHLRVGNYQEALKAFDRSIELHPRNGYAYFGRETVHWWRGDTERMLRDCVLGLLLLPTHDTQLGDFLRLYSPDSRRYYKPYWKDFADVYQRAVRRGDDGPRERSVLALSSIHSGGDLDEARRQAERAVEDTKRKNPLALMVLAEVQAALRQGVEAVRALEQAVRQTSVPAGTRKLLQERRLELAPAVASFDSVDELFGSGLTGQTSSIESRIHEAIKACELRGLQPVAKYLQVLSDERAGRLADAQATLEELLTVAVDDVQPIARKLVRLRARLGAVDAARELLESSLLRTHDARAQDWALWFELAALAGASDVSQLRAEAETLRAHVTLQESSRLEAGTLTVDTLRQLERDGQIRINCGGERYVDSEGEVWSSDRFFRGGKTRKWPISESIEGSKERLLLGVRRIFWPEYGTASYQIPLPCGFYQVKLHFVEFLEGPLKRQSFDVLCEEDLIRQDYSPREAGFCVADVLSFETSVADGEVHIEFSRRSGNPMISAIEIQRAH